jgi:hypothetical protein
VSGVALVCAIIRQPVGVLRAARRATGGGSAALPGVPRLLGLPLWVS